MARKLPIVMEVYPELYDYIQGKKTEEEVKRALEDVVDFEGVDLETARLLLELRVVNGELIPKDHEEEVLTNKGRIGKRYFLKQEYLGNGRFTGTMYFRARKKFAYIGVDFDFTEEEE